MQNPNESAAMKAAIQVCHEFAVMWAQQAMGGDRSGASDHKEAAAREIIEELRKVNAAQTAVVLDDERAAFQKWVMSKGAAWWANVYPEQAAEFAWQARAASPQATTPPEHSAIYISKQLTGSDKDASFVQAHINQAVSEAMELAAAQPAQTGTELLPLIASYGAAEREAGYCEGSDDFFNAAVARAEAALDGIRAILTAAQPASGADHD